MNPEVRTQPSVAEAPTLMMAVAKKLLPRAVDRNRFRRVAREAWLSRKRRAVVDVQRAQSTHPAPAISVFVRLMRRSPAWKTLPDGQLKRAWRDELDQLFDRVPWHFP